MPWEKNFNEAEVLDRAMNLFWDKGYEATSVQDLVQATGINRASLYGTFGTKHELFLKALGSYDQDVRARFFDRLCAEMSPREAIMAVFDAAIDAALNKEGPSGCLLVNTSIELADRDEEVGRIVAEGLRETENFFAHMLARLDAETEGDAAGDRRADAQHLLSLLTAIRVFSRARPEQALLRGLRDQAETLMA